MEESPYTEIKQSLSSVSIKELNYSCRLFLANNLDYKQVLLSDKGIARDYKGLAEQIGFSYNAIKMFEEFENRTIKILESWESFSDATLDKLIDYLEAMDRYDILEDLIPALHDSFISSSVVPVTSFINTCTVTPLSSYTNISTIEHPPPVTAPYSALQPQGTISFSNTGVNAIYGEPPPAITYEQPQTEMKLEECCSSMKGILSAIYAIAFTIGFILAVYFIVKKISQMSSPKQDLPTNKWEWIDRNENRLVNR